MGKGVTKEAVLQTVGSIYRISYMYKSIVYLEISTRAPRAPPATLGMALGHMLGHPHMAHGGASLL